MNSNRKNVFFKQKTVKNHMWEKILGGGKCCPCVPVPKFPPGPKTLVASFLGTQKWQSGFTVNFIVLGDQKCPNTQNKIWEPPAKKKLFFSGEKVRSKVKLLELDKIPSVKNIGIFHCFPFSTFETKQVLFSRWHISRKF
jgi:hypothetical protein